MENNMTYKVLVNAVIVKDGKILISQRDMNEKHQPGSWTIPGGKIENYNGEDEIFNIVEKTVVKEIQEEVGVEIKDNIHLIANNTFKHTQGHIVLVMVFLCEYKSGEAKPLEDTMDVRWISSNELSDYEFAPNVKDYIAKGFSLLPYMIRKKGKEES